VGAIIVVTREWAIVIALRHAVAACRRNGLILSGQARRLLSRVLQRRSNNMKSRRCR
jgi:hypothetical protein